MSKKPAAALSADLVAVKGAALPAPDMPGRGPHAAEPPLPAGGMPLNFRVPDSFRREFKVYAARHGLKLNELLRRSFEAYRREHGE
jgi:hypothetical protein